MAKSRTVAANFLSVRIISCIWAMGDELARFISAVMQHFLNFLCDPQRHVSLGLHLAGLGGVGCFTAGTGGAAAVAGAAGAGKVGSIGRRGSARKAAKRSVIGVLVFLQGKLNKAI